MVLICDRCRQKSMLWSTYVLLQSATYITPSRDLTGEVFPVSHQEVYRTFL